MGFKSRSLTLLNHRLGQTGPTNLAYIGIFTYLHMISPSRNITFDLKYYRGPFEWKDMLLNENPLHLFCFHRKGLNEEKKTQITISFQQYFTTNTIENVPPSKLTLSEIQ